MVVLCMVVCVEHVRNPLFLSCPVFFIEIRAPILFRAPTQRVRAHAACARTKLCTTEPKTHKNPKSGRPHPVESMSTGDGQPCFTNERMAALALIGPSATTVDARAPWSSLAADARLASRAQVTIVPTGLHYYDRRW